MQKHTTKLKNKYNMKSSIRLTLFAVALCGLCSCSDSIVDIPTPPDNAPAAISFERVDTRAGLADIQANGFGVWATTSSTANNSAAILTNEKVYLNADGNWTYDNTRYWLDDCKFYFFAMYPYSTDNSLIEELRLTQEGVNYTGYTMAVTTPAAADYDPLIATNYTDTSVEGFATTVPLTFEHLMTKINLKIEQDFDKDSEFDYYVSKVTITGVKGSGTLFAMPYGDGIYRGWNFENATPITFEKSYATPEPLRDLSLANPQITLTVFGDGLLLIPQEIAANSIRVRVDYYYDIDPTDNEYGDAKYVEAYVPVSPLWESNKSISYKIALSEKFDIVFLAPTIEPWGAPQTGGTIIIK